MAGQEEPKSWMEALERVVERIQPERGITLDEEMKRRVFAERYSASFQQQFDAGQWPASRDRLYTVAALHGNLVTIFAKLAGTTTVDEDTFIRSCEAVQTECRLWVEARPAVAPRGPWCQFAPTATHASV